MNDLNLWLDKTWGIQSTDDLVCMQILCYHVPTSFSVFLKEMYPGVGRMERMPLYHIMVRFFVSPLVLPKLIIYVCRNGGEHFPNVDT